LRSSPTLKPQTTALDVLIVPGSAPIDEPVITTSALWHADLTPIPPDDVRVNLTPVRHLTVFDVVEGTFTLQVTGARSRSAHEYWSCVFTTPLQLIDHDSVLPDLWSLRKSGPRGAPNEWLALSDPSTGPFRAIFSDLQTARGFASWVRASGATRIGTYRIGLFQPDREDGKTPPAGKRNSVVPFHEISREEMQALEVKRLGE